ncbi:MAG: ribonuclease P protein component [Propionibacteriaceae bacterium]
MLPARARLRSSDDFRTCVRQGVRVGRSTLVVHAHHVTHSGDSMESPRVGFVVSKAVGGAVVRNRVKRRLRHLVAEQLSATPANLHLVVRALPASATANDQLATDLASAWHGVLKKVAS